MVSVQRQRSPPLAPESQSACRFSTPTPKARDQHKQTLAMRAPAPRILGLDFINWAMSMAAACDSAADLPRVTRGRGLHRCDERKVQSCTLRIILWQLFVAVEILLLPSRSRWPMTAPVQASMVPPRLPALHSSHQFQGNWRGVLPRAVVANASVGGCRRSRAAGTG